MATTRNFMREIGKARREGDFLRAGDLYVLQGDEQDAVEMYLKGKHYEHAAKLLDKLDNYSLAAKYYALSGNLDRAARMLARDGDFLRAAGLFERCGDASKAAEMYYKAGNPDKAAEQAEKAGFLGRAAILYEKAEEYSKAAALQVQMLERAEQRHREFPYEGHFNAVQRHGMAAGRLLSRIGDHENAARCFEKAESGMQAAAAWGAAGQHNKAANLYISAHEYHKAADMLEKAGKFEHASEMAEKCERLEYAADLALKAGLKARAAKFYSKADKPTKAADLYFTLLIEAIDELASTDSRALVQRKVHEFAAECGILSLRLRNYPKAAWCFEQANNLRKAAECYSLGKLPEKAAEMLFKIKEYEKAYGFLKNVEEIQNKELFAEVCFYTNRFEEAGTLFSAINQPSKAAAAYEKGRQRYKAALLYEDLGELAKAAELYVLLEEKRKAADLFARAGEPLRSSTLYEELDLLDLAIEQSQKTDQTMRTAQLLIKKGDQKQAILLLQSIPADSADYLGACLRLGQLFGSLGIYQLSMQKLQEGLASQPIAKDNLEAYYNLAEACEHNGDSARSQKIYQEILAIQFDFKDVLSRIKQPEPQQKPFPGVAATPAPMPSVSAPRPAEHRTRVMTDLPPERKIREYELLEVLGKGGMATVYRAQHTFLKTERAIKVIRGKGAGDEFAERFIREARILSGLRHPNLIQMFEFGSLDDGVFFMALELVDGESVRDRVRRNGKLPIRKALQITQQAALGLHAAHEKGIIHRDISPDNLLLVEDTSGRESVKIIDFGVAKVLLSETWDYTSTGTFMGKPEYASPEQCGFLKEGESIDHRSDIYSLAITLQFILTGSLPFTSTSPQGYLMKHITQKPKSVLDGFPGCPQQIDDLITKAISARREKRHDSMQEFADDLQKILDFGF